VYHQTRSHLGRIEGVALGKADLLYTSGNEG